MPTTKNSMDLIQTSNIRGFLDDAVTYLNKKEKVTVLTNCQRSCVGTTGSRPSRR